MASEEKSGAYYTNGDDSEVLPQKEVGERRHSVLEDINMNKNLDAK